jgi:hypothetical protein
MRKPFFGSLRDYRDSLERGVTGNPVDPKEVVIRWLAHVNKWAVDDVPVNSGCCWRKWLFFFI